jgi:transketolase
MRNAFVDELLILSEDPDLIVLLADNGIIVFDEYTKRFPDQIINVGIAEANMVGVAAGLADTGFKPIIYSITPFVTMRVFEQIRVDICYQNTNVVIVGIGAGFAYSSLGPTHHAIEDIAIMRSLPNMKVLSPADPNETRDMINEAFAYEGPVYLRIGTGKNPVVYPKRKGAKIGKGDLLREGSDITIIATGTIVYDAMRAAEQLEDQGISVRLVNMSSIKPLDKDILMESLENTKAILTVEEHNVIGGLGSAVAELVAENATNTFRFKRMGLKDAFCKGYGSVDEVRKLNGLSQEDIVKSCLELFQEEKKSKR